MNKVVIFGIGDFSSLAWYALTHDSDHEVAAFTADGEYIDKKSHHGLPVVAFEALTETCPPGEFSLLVPLGPRRVNALRTERYLMAKSLGYRFVSYVSTRALIWPDLQVGENCMIYEGVIIQPFARIGDNCILRSGCNISHHADVADHVFISAGALVAGGARIGEGCYLGLGAIVRDNITVASHCMLGAGAVVVADTEENGLYVGIPAKRRELPSE
jgi:sugar O-acyltransferase (sialic acid O-acetyltransferase NeuD family)